MSELIVRGNNLPAQPIELAKFILFGDEKLNAVRAAISAMQKLGVAKEVVSLKLREAQDTAESVTLAKLKLGELISALPKATPNNNKFHEIATTVDLAKPKAETISELGISQKKAERLQTMAKNAEVVHAVMAKARGNDDVVSEAQILKEIKQVKRAEKQTKQEERRMENTAKVEELATPLDAKGLFQTIVIDPPWDWGDEGDVNQFGRAKPEYSTMPFDEIKALPVNKIADENCHLYLWVTNRSLPKAFAPSDTPLFYILPFQQLRKAFWRNFKAWQARFGMKEQASDNWHSSALFVPASVVVGAVSGLMILREG